MAPIPSLPNQRPLAQCSILFYRRHEPGASNNLRHSPLHDRAPTPPTNKHIRTYSRMSDPLHLDSHLSPSV